MRTPLLLLAALALALSPLALADDIDGDETRHKDRGSDAEVKEKRKVSVSASEGKVEIKLKRETGEVEDAVKIVYHADEGTMKVSHETENETTETETELKVKFREVVEFVDTDGDGAYTPKADRDVQRLKLDDLRWTVAAPTDVTSAGGVAGKRIVGTGAFPENGTLAFVLYVYGEFAEVNGTSLRPTEVKIDILFQDFPYQANDSRLALLVKAEQEIDIEVEEEKDDGEVEGLRAVGANHSAYFKWADNATVDGVVKPVVASILESEEDGQGVERKYALAYARGASINHDPVLGVDSADAPSGEAHEDSHATPGFSLVVGVCAAFVAALALRRK